MLFLFKSRLTLIGFNLKAHQVQCQTAQMSCRWQNMWSKLATNIAVHPVLTTRSNVVVDQKSINLNWIQSKSSSSPVANGSNVMSLAEYVVKIGHEQCCCCCSNMFPGKETRKAANHFHSCWNPFWNNLKSCNQVMIEAMNKFTSLTKHDQQRPRTQRLSKSKQVLNWMKIWRKVMSFSVREM